MLKVNESTSLLTRGQNKKLFLVKVEEKIGQNFFTIWATIYWNVPQICVVEVPSMRAFESR